MANMKLIKSTNMQTLEINKQEEWIDLSPYHSLHEDTQNPSPLYE